MFPAATVTEVIQSKASDTESVTTNANFDLLTRTDHEKRHRVAVNGKIIDGWHSFIGLGPWTPGNTGPTYASFEVPTGTVKHGDTVTVVESTPR